MGSSRTQLFSGLGVGIGVDIGTVAACLPFCLGGAHNSWCPVNWLVGCCVAWLDGCSTAWLTAWLVVWVATQSLAIWRCIVFPLLVFVTLIAIRCSLAALGGKLIAFAAEFLFSFLVFYYLKFMSVFGIESRDGQRRAGSTLHEVVMQFSCLLTHSRCLLCGASGNGNCRATARFIVFCAVVAAACCFLSFCSRCYFATVSQLFHQCFFCRVFVFQPLQQTPNSSKATSVSPLVAYITFN